MESKQIFCEPITCGSIKISGDADDLWMMIYNLNTIDIKFHEVNNGQGVTIVAKSSNEREILKDILMQAYHMIEEHEVRLGIREEEDDWSDEEENLLTDY